MRTIQEVGTEILNNTPGKFYIFGGTEHGIKSKYLSILKDHYDGRMSEYDSVDDVLNMMSKKRFIPLEPSLYVVRYDPSFVSGVSEFTKKRIDSAKIIGTLVCVYDEDKHITKLAKHLSDYMVKIEEVSIQFKIKYLHSDFPNLPNQLINISAKYASDYGEAQLMCSSMSAVEPERLCGLKESQIIKLFGKRDSYSDKEIRRGVAAKNFKYLVKILDDYAGEYDSIFYIILSTMIELERILNSKYAKSDIAEYAKRWMEPDIYNMFLHTYEAIRKLRTYATNAESMIIYLFSLLKFDHVPSVDMLEMD